MGPQAGWSRGPTAGFGLLLALRLPGALPHPETPILRVKSLPRLAGGLSIDFTLGAGEILGIGVLILVAVGFDQLHTCSAAGR